MMRLTFTPALLVACLTLLFMHSVHASDSEVTDTCGTLSEFERRVFETEATASRLGESVKYCIYDEATRALEQAKPKGGCYDVEKDCAGLLMKIRDCVKKNMEPSARVAAPVSKEGRVAISVRQACPQTDSCEFSCCLFGASLGLTNCVC